MKVHLSWLRDYVDIDISPEELSNKLIGSGFEVEGIEYLGKNIKNVVVARILSVSKHPNADKLSICEMDIGNNEKRVILTAATNVFQGAVVPAALDGALLPNGLKIKTCQMRGVESQGMLCSPNELCIDETVIENGGVDGILILPKDAESSVGRSIIDYFGWDDYVFDVSITSNRPDCGSVLGLAREIAALTAKELRMPSLEFQASKSGKISDYIAVRVQDKINCPNYNCSIVKDIRIEPSPKWMRDRLRLSGIRPINNIVDITNYVLLEIGAPMHAFDTSLIKGNEINIRGAKSGESITALDGKVYVLKEGMLLICDKEKPVGIAGVMGGEYSGINPDTKTIAFEAARFLRGSVRLTSRALGLRSESSARFEKGVDAGTASLGMQRALSLISELKCGTIVDGIATIQHEVPKKRIIEVSIKKIDALLGMEIPNKEKIEILRRLDIVTRQNADMLVLEIPLYRDDLESYQDIAEEIIRIYGYEHIEPTLPLTQNELGGLTDEQKLINQTKNTLCGLGAFETATYSFVNKSCFSRLCLDEHDPRRNAAVIKNPISEEFGIMRTLMAHNYIEALALNQNRKNYDARLFEIAKVYLPESIPLKTVPKEATRLAIGITGKEESFFTLKGIVEEVLSIFGITADYVESSQPFLHSGISADIIAHRQTIGYLGEIHPLVQKNYELTERCFLAEIDFDFLLNKGARKVRFKPLAKFQEIERDIALTIRDEIKAQEVLTIIKKAAGSLAESVELFDVYKGQQIGEGYKSLAYKIIFRSNERTLVDDEITEIMNKMIGSLKTRLNAKVRGLD